MKSAGLTLIELLIVIIILAILAVSAAPSFQQLIQNTQTKTAQKELLEAIEYTRSLAVYSGTRSVLKAKGEWHNGWEIFLDKNDDGVLGAGEEVLIDHPSLRGVFITGKPKLEKLVSFISTGEGRNPAGVANRGAFLTGTLIICPDQQGKGYKLILSRGGRTRTEEADVRDCN